MKAARPSARGGAELDDRWNARTIAPSLDRSANAISVPPKDEPGQAPIARFGLDDLPPPTGAHREFKRRIAITPFRLTPHANRADPQSGLRDCKSLFGGTPMGTDVDGIDLQSGHDTWNQARR
jgi:hypothetical protein